MPVKFRKQLISAQPYESAAVFDVDGDGVPDIVSGAFWYQGPDFRKMRPIRAVAAYGEYFDDFSTIPMDVNGDGRIDFVTGGWWGNSLRWIENPADLKHEWNEHVIASGIGSIETTRAWDIDGDGELEIVPNTPGHPLCAYKLIRDPAGKPTGEFSKHILYDKGVGHGLGFGDLDGNGRGVFITIKGVLAPTGHPLNDPWDIVETIDFGHWDLSVPVLIVDLNSDGLNEIIVGHAHSYGLDWYQQSKDASGKRVWTRHPIDPFCSQYHDLWWVDIDGDGKPELVTGKRHRAHNGNDIGEDDPLGCYYFKWTGEGFAKQVIDYDASGVGGGGVGIHFYLADLRGTGKLDLVAPGKDGLYVYFNETTVSST